MSIKLYQETEKKVVFPVNAKSCSSKEGKALTGGIEWRPCINKF